MEWRPQIEVYLIQICGKETEVLSKEKETEMETDILLLSVFTLYFEI